MLFKHTKPWFMTLACVLLVSSGAFGQRAYLVVDRTTGAAEAISSADIAVDGYSITSASGLLNVDGWSSLNDQGAAGWTEANPEATRLTELTVENGGLQAGTGVGLGSPYSAGVAALPSDEDLQFQITVPNADATQPGSIVDGFVVYTGPSQAPTLSVDRGTGAISISNPAGFEIDGFSIGSASGLLDPAGLAAVTGFTSANPTSSLVSGLNWEGGSAGPLELGNVFAPGGVVGINAEDLTLQYTRPDSVSAFTGVVNYTGAVNDLVLQVNEITGAASIQHMSPNVGAVEVTGYSVLSASDGLDVGAWQKIGGEFAEAGPRAGAIAELNLNGSKTFSNGTMQDLGSIFSGSSRDLVFEYSTPEIDKAFGSVEYVIGASGPTCADIAASRFGGDLDGDGTVAFADFLVLSNNFGNAVSGYADGDIDCNGTVAFADFLVLSNNFGQSAAAEASAVPEPASVSLAMLAMLMGLSFRKRR